MSAIGTLRAYRTLKNAENVDDAIEEIERIYRQLDEQAEELDRLRAEVEQLKKALANLYYNDDPASHEAAYPLINTV